MYLAELHGKLSLKTERMEDILTSNVFSFFKYSNREIFLKKYLNSIGFNISTKDAKEAKFIFWPRYEENTEPDLVIMVGKYYILIEAKYFSDFSLGNKDIKSQIEREIENGSRDAENYGLKFHFVAITADYFYKEDKFAVIPKEFVSNFKWTSWQKVTSFLEETIGSHNSLSSWEGNFASDLFKLLDRKNLRAFHGINNLSRENVKLKSYDSIFLETKTVMFRGDFIGFLESLSVDERLVPIERVFFGSKVFWETLKQKHKINNHTTIFWEK